jgi:hypothetical protein
MPTTMSMSLSNPAKSALAASFTEKKWPMMRALAVMTMNWAASAKSPRSVSRVGSEPFCRNCDNFQRCTCPGKFKLGTSNSLEFLFGQKKGKKEKTRNIKLTHPKNITRPVTHLHAITLHFVFIWLSWLWKNVRGCEGLRETCSLNCEREKNDEKFPCQVSSLFKPFFCKCLGQLSGLA